MKEIMKISEIENLQFNERGLIPVITQCFETKDVLMMAWMNKMAIERTIRLHKVTYFSRSRNELWEKGESSGNFQKLKMLIPDCDKDTLLAVVEQIGVACHKGTWSCFNETV